MPSRFSRPSRPPPLPLPKSSGKPLLRRNRNRGDLCPKAPPTPPLVSEAKKRGREAAALVTAAKQGDPVAFSELVRRYRPRIFALALHLTGNAGDADDIAQEAFINAFRKIGEFEGRSEFFTWIYRIALHRALNTRRASHRRVMIDFNDPRVCAATAVDAEGDPRRALELRETYATLVAAFDQLSPTLRGTVTLTALQGLSHKEAAVILNTTEGTIAWRVHEARAQLRRMLDDSRAVVLAKAKARSTKQRTMETEQESSSGLETPNLELALLMLI